ncbi:MAG: DUF58 domain-containing protein [Spirochaetes bacterium]|nr:DUF58 domain-containing protein [Spirochaetota bacterium]
MIPKELVKKIRYIQLYTSKSVTSVFAGEYESAFKGQGMEFDEVREYYPGDEVRNIDWNITARMGKPYIKRYVEERELTVIFLVDLSASGSFGSVEKTKNEIAAELCALISFAAIKNNDKVGLIIFTDQVEMYIPPKKGITHSLRLIRELLYFKPKKTKTDIIAGLDYLGRVTQKKAVVFLVSDFQEAGFEHKVRVAGKKHDLIAVTINDPREISMPDVGIIELLDAETGEIVTIDTSSKKVRDTYQKLGNQQLEQLKKTFRSMGVDQINIQTNDDYMHKIAAFFLNREKRM